ncbi:MAG: hypothetical protein JNL50_10140 [Phycisphaerae bacterium]|nr:hypothetical protein [Phycisphaerae bacterium]
MKIVAALAVLACAGAAVAGPIQSGNSGAGSASIGVARAVLWNQNTTNFNGVVDQDFPDFATYSAGMVDDFSTGGQTWNVNRVTTYYTQGIGIWPAGNISAQLSLYTKSGSSPTGADLVGNLGSVSATLVNLSGAWALVADTSGVGALQGINGDFWVGLTPTLAFGSYGQEFHLLSGVATNGAGSAVRNVGGSFGFGSDWYDAGSLGGQPEADMLFTLEGDVVPAPGAAALLALGGIFAGRRRR